MRGGSGAIATNVAKTAVAPIEGVKGGRDTGGGMARSGMCKAAEELGQGNHMVTGFR